MSETNKVRLENLKKRLRKDYKYAKEFLVNMDVLEVLHCVQTPYVYLYEIVGIKAFFKLLEDEEFLKELEENVLNKYKKFSVRFESSWKEGLFVYFHTAGPGYPIWYKSLGVKEPEFVLDEDFCIGYYRTFIKEVLKEGLDDCI